MPTKDQERARRAYQQVEALANDYRTAGNDEDKRKAHEVCDNYEIAVKALGANILRSGLSAALADLMRRKEKGAALRGHIDASSIPGFEGVSAEGLFQRANGLEVGPYMLATREVLQVVTWLKRATEALFDNFGGNATTSD